MLKRIKDLVQKNESLAFETTLASRSFAKLVQDCKKSGYDTTLIYFWLSNLDIAINRVAFRVKLGGHDIPTNVSKRRYARSRNNLHNLYLPLVDNAYIFDSSENQPIEIAKKVDGGSIEIVEQSAWEMISDGYK